MKTHRNLPFFVPHAGCPNCCVFCSQEKITGQRAEKDINTEVAELRDMLDKVNSGWDNSLIAFFGGSFTAIGRDRMETLLTVANEYIKKGVAQGIRISTRPDKISGDVLDVLERYNVTHIELGIQSTDERVLALSGRGHTAVDSFNAAELINKRGFVLGGQMMVGLPGSDEEKEIKTAQDIVKMGAKEARIYPTVVFENTELCRMAQRGEYVPLGNDLAASRTAKCYRIFHNADIKVLRVGLHASENLAHAAGGANHPAMGELVKSCVYTDIISEMAGDCRGQRLEICVQKCDISMLVGHGRAAVKRLMDITGAEEIEIIPMDVPQFSPRIIKRSV